MHASTQRMVAGCDGLSEPPRHVRRLQSEPARRVGHEAQVHHVVVEVNRACQLTQLPTDGVVVA